MKMLPIEFTECVSAHAESSLIEPFWTKECIKILEVDSNNSWSNKEKSNNFNYSNNYIKYKVTQKIYLDIYKGIEKLWTKSEICFCDRK